MLSTEGDYSGSRICASLSFWPEGSSFVRHRKRSLECQNFWSISQSPWSEVQCC